MTRKINPLHTQADCHNNGFTLKVKTLGGKETYVIENNGDWMFDGSLRDVHNWIGAYTYGRQRGRREGASAA